jgi:hypothetical protein
VLAVKGRNVDAAADGGGAEDIAEGHSDDCAAAAVPDAAGRACVRSAEPSCRAMHKTADFMHASA